MTTLAIFTKYEIGILVTAFAAIVLYQFLTGRVNTRGLLSEHTGLGADAVSPARVQLFLFTLAMAFYVLSEILRFHRFPEIETKWLLILGGSHSVFLGAKGVLSLLSSKPS
jgi:hypothetical protein